MFTSVRLQLGNVLFGCTPVIGLGSTCGAYWLLAQSKGALCIGFGDVSGSVLQRAENYNGFYGSLLPVVFKHRWLLFAKFSELGELTLLAERLLPLLQCDWISVDMLRRVYYSGHGVWAWPVSAPFERQPSTLSCSYYSMRSFVPVYLPTFAASE